MPRADAVLEITHGCKPAFCSAVSDRSEWIAMVVKRAADLQVYVDDTTVCLSHDVYLCYTMCRAMN